MWANGKNDGKKQVFLSPGLVVGKLHLWRRLGFAFGGGVQIAATQFHAYEHNWVTSVRFPSDVVATRKCRINCNERLCEMHGRQISDLRSCSRSRLLHSDSPGRSNALSQRQNVPDSDHRRCSISPTLAVIPPRIVCELNDAWLCSFGKISTARSCLSPSNHPSLVPPEGAIRDSRATSGTPAPPASLLPGRSSIPAKI
jgi:hypothetical protein